MIAFLKSLVESIGTLVRLVRLMIKGLFNFTAILPKGMTVMMDGAMQLPEFIVGFATVGIIVAVILTILGRSSTGVQGRGN